MTNKQKYDDAFITVLEVEIESINESLVYNGIKTWDSIGHMNLMSTIEDIFDIMIDTDDIVEFNSYINGIEILKKYGVII